MTIISFNGIERIGKSYYCGIINNYLKKVEREVLKEDLELKKFTFPSYTTTAGRKLMELIKQFKQDDLLAVNNNTHNRYRKIAEYLIKNYEEYKIFIEGFTHHNKENHIALINNNYFSIIAHGLAANVHYNTIRNMLKDIYLKKEKTLAFFLISNDVSKTLSSPYLSHDTYGRESWITLPSELSEDYINYFKYVNNYYKQIYLTLYYTSSNIKPVLIEVDGDILSTVNRIKKEIISWV